MNTAAQDNLISSIQSSMSNLQVLDGVLLIMVTLCFVGAATLILLRNKKK